MNEDIDEEHLHLIDDQGREFMWVSYTLGPDMPRFKIFSFEGEYPKTPMDKCKNKCFIYFGGEKGNMDLIGIRDIINRYLEKIK